LLELAIVLLLVVLNGLFALSELAIVSSRRSRLKALAESGRRGARRALALASEPGRFLSTVQIGITLVGILAGAFSGATLGSRLSTILVSYGMTPRVAEPLGFGLVVVAITYLSLIVGELVPKQLALRHAEAIACAVAPFMTTLSRIAAPLVSLLDASTRAFLWMLGQGSSSTSVVTEEEIRSLIAEAESAGVLERGERQMISGVLRLADRAVQGIMTPRTDVEWIDITETEDEIKTRLITTAHSRLPVGEGSSDKLIGVVETRVLLSTLLSGGKLDLRAHVRRAPIIPDTMDALDALSVLREAEVPMALIHDEYGNFEGLVTPTDILESIAGAFRSEMEEPHAVQRADGTWLLAGSMPVDEMAEELGVLLPATRQFQTVAGLVLWQLGHLPSTGEAVEAFNWRFEVVDLDGRRIDKVLATPVGAKRRRAA
jgi:putative hemolysin